MKPLNQIRDESWLSWAKDIVNNTHDKPTTEKEIIHRRIGQPPFFAGFDSAIKTLSEMGSEFDIDVANKALMEWIDKFYPSRFDDHDDYNIFVGFGVYGFRWQHSQSKAREGLLLSLLEECKNSFINIYQIQSEVQIQSTRPSGVIAKEMAIKLKSILNKEGK